MTTTKALPQLTCGLAHMFNRVISQHRAVHYGALPKRIELHPALLPALILEIMDLDRPSNGPLRYHGVEIAITTAASMPRLITCRNDIVYL